VAQTAEPALANFAASTPQVSTKSRSIPPFVAKPMSEQGTDELLHQDPEARVI
jgi:hypothetical protein